MNTELKAIAESPGMTDIITLQMLPYGAASGSGDAIECQHGPQECVFNKISACAFSLYLDPKEVVLWSLCVDNQTKLSTPAAPEVVITTCGGAKQGDIKSCFAGGKAAERMTEIARQTAALKLQYSPWIMVNGKHMDWHLSLFAEVCKAYTGPDRPAECGTPLALVDTPGSSYADLLCYQPGTSP